MNYCGYVYLSDCQTNRQDIMKIVVYDVKNHKDICEDTLFAEYIISKTDRKFLNTDINFPYVSYLMLMEIFENAISLDKLVKYPLIAKFYFDIQGNPVLEVHNTYKEIFPVPYKAHMYMEKRTYFNITEQLTGSEILTVLMADVICTALNYVAYTNGYKYDRLFYAVCGRVFIDASVMSLYTCGMKFLKSVFPSKYIRCIDKRFLFSFKTKPKIKTIGIQSEDYKQFVNPFLKISTMTIQSLIDKKPDVMELIKNPDMIVSLCTNEIELFKLHADNLAWQGVIKKPGDFDFVTIDDLYSLQLAEGMDKIQYSVENNRKFYNANKDKNICVLYSDGRCAENFDIQNKFTMFSHWSTIRTPILRHKNSRELHQNTR